MKESDIDIENFDQVREWCEENIEEFTSERLERVIKAVKEEIKCDIHFHTISILYSILGMGKT